MLEGGIEGGREGKEGAREGGRNQLLLVYDVIKIKCKIDIASTLH